MQCLREKVEKVLGFQILEVLLITPHLRALYDEDISDVLEYLGLRSPEEISMCLCHIVWSKSCVVDLPAMVSGYVRPTGIQTCAQKKEMQYRHTDCWFSLTPKALSQLV